MFIIFHIVPQFKEKLYDAINNALKKHGVHPKVFENALERTFKDDQ